MDAVRNLSDPPTPQKSTKPHKQQRRGVAAGVAPAVGEDVAGKSLSVEVSQPIDGKANAQASDEKADG